MMDAPEIMANIFPEVTTSLIVLLNTMIKRNNPPTYLPNEDKSLFLGLVSFFTIKKTITTIKKVPTYSITVFIN